MIWHFLKRDLISSRFLFMLYFIAIFFVSILPGPWINKLEFYFIFSQILASWSIGTVAGSKWRTQQAISRSYLLSLPIDRMRLFSIQIIRVLIYSIPLVSILALAPLSHDKFLKYVNIIPFGYLFYLLNAILITIWMGVGFLSISFAMEKFSSHLTQKQRYKVIGKIILFVLIEISCVFGGVTAYFFRFPAISTAAMTLIVLFQITLTRIQWRNAG